VLNVSDNIENFHPDKFSYTRLALPDEAEADIANHFQEAFRIIDSAVLRGERVLVHCQLGVSRSATIVIAYLMHHKQWTLKQAYDYVRSRRRQVFPNGGFWKQLAKHEQHIHSDKADFQSSLNDCVDMTLIEQEAAQRRRSMFA